MAKETPKIESHEIFIEKINDKHDLSNFKSYEKELVNFLIEDALNNQMQKLSITFLWFYEKNLVGYETLLNDKINLEGNLKDFFREKDIQNKSGCRFITLDAKRNEIRGLDSIHFYKKLGFKILKERIKGTTPMYLDLKTPQQ